MTDIELEETLAHIHQMRVDSEHKLEDMRRIIAEHDRRRQEIWWYPWVVVISGMTAGGALVAAGATLTKLFG
jgi:hypothetical protein